MTVVGQRDINWDPAHEAEVDAEIAKLEKLRDQAHDRRRIEVRSETSFETCILGLLDEVLTELKRSNSVAREGAVSSVAIEDMAKGPPKITSKAYSGSPLSREDVDAALEMHGYVHREAERRSLAGWAETIEAESEKRKATAQGAALYDRVMGSDDAKDGMYYDQAPSGEIVAGVSIERGRHLQLP